MIRFVFCVLLSVLTIGVKGDLDEIAQRLVDSYEKQDYEAFMEAFPDDYDTFYELYGFDSKNGGKPLYYIGMEHVFFFFKEEDVIAHRYLGKLLSLSEGFIWDADAPNFFTDGCNKILHAFPDEITEFLNEKTDEEVVSFLRLCILTGFPTYDHYIEDYDALSKEYASYSERIVALLKTARLMILNDPDAYEYCLFGPDGFPEAPKDKAMPK